MEEQFNFDLNLDFLDSSALNTHQSASNTRSLTVPVQSTYDIESLASRIASVNDLTIQLKTVKDESARLQKQMQDLSDSAMSVRCLYEREKTEKAKYTLLCKELQDKLDEAESELTNKTLHFEQLTSQIEQSAEKGPISYNELALRYQRLALQLEDDKLLNYKEKTSLHQIQQYIEAKKITILPAYKKKLHLKKHFRDYAVQCNIKTDTKTQGTQYTLGTSTGLLPVQKVMCAQGTQYTWYTTTRGTNTPAHKITQKDVRTQGTQYISSATTRGTSTSAFIQKQSIGTNFPEVLPVSIEDIFKEMISNVSPLSPMCSLAEEELQCKEKVEMRSVSTNTGLKNIRRPIDYAPPSIKHSDSRPPSRNMYDRVKNESPFIGMPTLNPFTGMGMTPLPLHNTVAELWNMLGHTIFALLQNDSTASNSPMHTHAVNDHMRNLNADTTRRREQKRSSDERSNSGKDYFEDECLNNRKDYLTANRSTATSPISPTELNDNEHYISKGVFDGIYVNPSDSSSAFVSVPRSTESSQVETIPPVEIQKIVLKNHEAATIDTSSEKSSRVDKILKLFPEHSHSLQKRKDIKRLLKKEKKIKKKTTVSYFEGEYEIQKQIKDSLAREMTEGLVSKVNVHKPIEINWKEELFGTSDDDSTFSDSSQSLSPEFAVMNEIRAQAVVATLKQPGTRFTPTVKRESKRSPISIHNSPDSRNDDGFLGFDGNSNINPPDVVFCKPLLPRNRVQQLIASNTFNSSENIFKQDAQREKHNSSEETLISSIRNLLETASNSETKRRAGISLAVHSNKINKSNNLSNTVIHSNAVLPAQKFEQKMPSISVSYDQAEPTQCISMFHDQTALSFTNRSVVEPENSPKSILYDQNMLSLNEKTAPVHTKTPKTEDTGCRLTTGVVKNALNSSLSLRKHISTNPEKNPDFIIQDQIVYNLNDTASKRPQVHQSTELQDQTLLKFNDLSSAQHEGPHFSAEPKINLRDLTALGIEKTSKCIVDWEKTFEFDKVPAACQEKLQTSRSKNQETLNELTGPDQKKHSSVFVHDKITSNSYAFKGPSQELSPNTVIYESIYESKKNQSVQSQEQDQNNQNLMVNNQAFIRSIQNFNKPRTAKEEKSFNTILLNPKPSNCLGLEIPEEMLSISMLHDQKSNNLTKVNDLLSEKESVKFNNLTSQLEIELLKDQRFAMDTAESRLIKSPSSTGTSPTRNSDREAELLIDYPESPKAQESSSLDLSLLLKTPKKDNPRQRTTPDSYNRNTSTLSKVLTSSTENLVEEFLLNESPESNGPKFQIFLDKILDEIAPPLSPISVMSTSEKPINRERKGSCDEEAPKTQVEELTSGKRKRKAPATAAIAVKRSARLKAKHCADTSTVSNLNLLNIPGIQLGKYTKKSSEPRKPLKKLKEIEQEKVEKEVETVCNFRMGFFKDLMEEEKNQDSPIKVPLVDEVPEANGKPNAEFLDTAKDGNQQVSRNPAEFFGKTPLATTNLKANPLMHVCKSVSDSYQRFQTTLPEKDSMKKEHFNLKDVPLVSSSNECPASPPPMDQAPDESHITREFDESTQVTAKPTSNSMLSHIIANYNLQRHKMLTQARQTNKKLLNQLQFIINNFTSGLCLVMDCIRTVDVLLNHTTSERLIAEALIEIVKTVPRPETEVPSPVPDQCLSQMLQKILALLEPLYQRLPGFRGNLQSSIEHSLFTFTKDIIPLEVLMNLTQFYLATIADPIATTNPARLFICKCLYFYNQKAIPMIYETLCVYPSVLPKREDLTYDRSDALINTIQCLLMSTYYDMEKTDLKTKQILTKLRKFYNYESFKPPRDEIIGNLMAKIRAGRFKNVSYAFALICKRMEQKNSEKIVLEERLLPLANEYYNTLSESTENDEKIACVLECISFVIKPFSLDTNISTYTNLFGRFLNASERCIIQEAALAALLRTIRFGYVHCFNAIYNFKPNYELADATKAMLQSFVDKKSLDFLKRLEHQARLLVAT